jgi:hypothetical protein
VITWETVCRLAEELPEVEHGTSYGEPALRVRGKLFAWMSPSEPGALVLRVDPEERPLMIDARPDLYFVTPHYADYPMVLARPEAMDEDELRDRLGEAWLLRAPKRLAEEFVGDE